MKTGVPEFDGKPFRAEKDRENHFHVVDSSGATVAIFPPCGDEKTSAKENAKAAAALPELIEACMAALPCLRDNPEFSFEEKLLNRALYKAGVRWCCNRRVTRS